MTKPTHKKAPLAEGGRHSTSFGAAGSPSGSVAQDGLIGVCEADCSTPIPRKKAVLTVEQKLATDWLRSNLSRNTVTVVTACGVSTRQLRRMAAKQQRKQGVV